MNIYPAMQATMGRWKYYIVKMSMRELADNVNFAADVYEDQTLDDAIQRVLNESRVKRDLVTYLIRQEDRFFSSLVVAALHGNPRWYPVTMEDDERFELFKDDPRLNETFGLLSFDGTQDYYALDGQHRLAAVKALVSPDSDVSGSAPRGFKDEEVSVIVVVPQAAETEQEFLVRYRRLFGNLNRYAKPTDQVTNIIMDEDDAFAIVTRQLITDHEFFKYSGRGRESPRIKTEKGKNLRKTDPYFTSLETLYDLNVTLLTTQTRRNKGWDEEGQDFRYFRRFRPSEEFLDSLFKELVIYWDALLGELPVLWAEPKNMRDHGANEDTETEDNVLFWPIGQELLADVARDLLNFVPEDPDSPTLESCLTALEGLSSLVWDFHRPPWRHLLLIPEGADSSGWRIRNEDRKDAQLLGKRIVKWQIGLDELNESELNGLRQEWEDMLLPALEEAEKDALWREIEESVVR